jgi:hypothetical protein
VPLVGTVGAAPAAATYAFTASDATPFTVTLTPLDGCGEGSSSGSGSGAPELVAALGYAPNASTHQWGSRAAPSAGAAEAIAVTWQEHFLPPPAATDFPVTFSLAALGGAASACRFSLLATSLPYARLEAGLPASLALAPGALAYALFSAPPRAPDGQVTGFTVSLTPPSPASLSPPPLLYVNVAAPSPGCPHCGFPACAPPQPAPCAPQRLRNVLPEWSTAGSGSAFEVAIQPHDAWFVPGAVYVVAVLMQQQQQQQGGGGSSSSSSSSSSSGDAPPALATLTVALADGATELLDGVPQPGLLRGGAGADGEYAFYFLTIVSLEVSVAVALTPGAVPLGGELDLYLSTNSSVPRPTAGAHSAAARGGPGRTAALEVPWAALHECPGSSVANAILCHVFIAVRCRACGGAPAAFTLTAEALARNATAMLLTPGLPQFNVVRASETLFYYAPLALPPGTPYSLLLNPHGVAKVYGYATTDGSRPSPTNPAARATARTSFSALESENLRPSSCSGPPSSMFLTMN